MKFLFVSGMYPSPENPGYGTFVKRQAEALRALGHQVEVVANTDSRTGTAHALKKYSSLYRRARRTAAKDSYDLVVGHFLYPNAWIARAAARAARAPYVVIAHGTDVTSLSRDGFLAAWSRNAVRHADGVITVSHYLLHQLEETVQLHEQTPRAVINMGIDTSIFYPRSRAAAREELGLAARAKIIVVVGNMNDNKGQQRALAVCAPLITNVILDQLIFVGDGETRAALEKIAHYVEVDRHVPFVGYQEQSQVALYLAAANLVLIPSFNEGLGLVILEALACGTPVAATKTGGIPEILPPEPWGYLLESSHEGTFSWFPIIEGALKAEPPSDTLPLPPVAGANSIAKKAQEFAEFCSALVRS